MGRTVASFYGVRVRGCLENERVRGCNVQNRVHNPLYARTSGAGGITEAWIRRNLGKRGVWEPGKFDLWVQGISCPRHDQQALKDTSFTLVSAVSCPSVSVSPGRLARTTSGRACRSAVRWRAACHSPETVPKACTVVLSNTCAFSCNRHWTLLMSGLSACTRAQPIACLIRCASEQKMACTKHALEPISRPNTRQNVRVGDHLARTHRRCVFSG